jgi:hypothetical protein
VAFFTSEYADMVCLLILGDGCYTVAKKIKWLSAYIKGDEVSGIFKILKIRSIYIHRIIFEEVDVEPAGSRGNGVTGRTAALASEAR